MPDPDLDLRQDSLRLDEIAAREAQTAPVEPESTESVPTEPASEQPA